MASLYVTGSGFVGGVDVLKAEAKWKKRLEEEETKEEAQVRRIRVLRKL